MPTYNRAALLHRSLEALAAQRFPDGDFEVIVADDGSSDTTRDVVESFAGRLRIRYVFQQDEGFRAAAARNAGARLASAPVLVFLDTGVLAGPGLVRAHYDAHLAATAPAGPGRAVLGYTYGHNRFEPFAGLRDVLAGLRPEEAVERLGADEAFHDMRHARLARVDFDLQRLVSPWWLFWSLNISVAAESFRAVGGFDEDFRGWGLEDVELGFRLARHGTVMAVSRAAWAVDTPHERDTEAASASTRRNAMLFLRKHPGPFPEMVWARYTWQPRMDYEEASRELVDWTEKAPRDLSAELSAATRDAFRTGGPSLRLAVLGSGGVVPSWWPASCTLMDFDGDLLQAALAGGRHVGHHAIGLQTRLEDGAFDVVVVSSRLAGLWERWGQGILAEARRIGASVRVPFLEAPDAGH